MTLDNLGILCGIIVIALICVYLPCPAEGKDAFWQGALNACAVVATFAFVLWVILPPWKVIAPVCPQPAVAGVSQDDKERLLCDHVVDALLHSKDPVEIVRAQAIIQDENCGIGKR